MIAAALSGLLLLTLVTLIFGACAVANCSWQRAREIWRDLSKPLP